MKANMRPETTIKRFRGSTRSDGIRAKSARMATQACEKNMIINTDGLHAKTTPKYRRPVNYIGRNAARNIIKRAGNPTRKQRKLRYEIAEVIAKERTWIK